MRPIPLNTVEMIKLISSKLRIDSHQAMSIAENLYNKGYISYPRTETQKFGNVNVKNFVMEQQKSDIWGDYARDLIEGKLLLKF